MRIFVITLIMAALGCSRVADASKDSSTSPDTPDLVAASTVYESPDLVVRQLSQHCYAHISYLNTNSFGRVDCNGMIVVNKNEAIVFDTPTDTISSAELIDVVRNKLGAKIKAVIPTHFHEDCVGGLSVFKRNNIPAYATARTIELLRSTKNEYAAWINAFSDSLRIDVQGAPVEVKYFGAGHTRDNVVGYCVADNVMFGGCLLKSMGASKGYLEDADVKEWPATVTKVKKRFANTKVVIPGHGNHGSAELLDYTIDLFSPKD